MNEIENKKLGTIIGGFKAIGKSTLSKKYENIIDLESSNFEYIIDAELEKIPVEQRKGLKSRKLNPDYPLNYYNEIIKNAKENKIVLFACKKEIVNLLIENNIDYYIIYPEENMLDEIIERSRKRGNREEFINRIKDVYYMDYPSNNQKVIWMKKGQFLEDVLLKNSLLD